MQGSYHHVFTKYFLDASALESMKARASEIDTLIAPFINDPRTIILSDNANFHYLALGMKPRQIVQIFGGLSSAEGFVYAEWSKSPHSLPYIPKDFLIIDKKWQLEHYSNTPHANPHIITTLTHLFNGDYPYTLVASSTHYLLFRNTDTAHSNITPATPSTASSTP